MVLYLPVRQNLYHVDLGNYVSYGLKAVSLSIFSIRSITFVSDVTPDKKQIFHLAWLCSIGQLDPNQLLDVIEDFI